MRDDCHCKVVFTPFFDRKGPLLLLSGVHIG